MIELYTNSKLCSISLTTCLKVYSLSLYRSASTFKNGTEVCMIN